VRDICEPLKSDFWSRGQLIRGSVVHDEAGERVDFGGLAEEQQGGGIELGDDRRAVMRSPAPSRARS
jgi:hypothetical protein